MDNSLSNDLTAQADSIECSTCQHSISACICAIGDVRKTIHNLLNDTSEPKLSFVPRSTILQLTYDKVLSLLRTLITPRQDEPGDHEHLLQSIAQFVSPGDGGCQICRNTSCTGGRILFIALVMMAKENDIQTLYNSRADGVCDTQLHRTSTALKFPFDWSDSDRALYFQMQTRMRSPFLTRWVPDGVIQTLDELVTLPWTFLGEPVNQFRTKDEDVKPLPRTIVFSEVRKIKIHPDHHEFKTEASCFALKSTKIIKKSSETRFKKELEAIDRIGEPHERIVSHVAAFRHGKTFYMILPWAEGGSLTELWKAVAPNDAPGSSRPSWCTINWLLEQSLGIAEGLSYMHNQRSRGSIHKGLPQVHADIKPENILAFSTTLPDGSTSYILKLTDFGHSRPVDGTGSINIKDIKNSMSYYPPERNLGHKTASLRWDIWCLGCLFLEFVTWYMHGCNGIEQFREDRLADPEDETIPKEEQLDISDIFFYLKVSNPWTSRLLRLQIRKAADVKKSVKIQISKLQKGKLLDARLHALLRYIQRHMLVADNSRGSADDVRDFLLRKLIR